jgi:GntR family transcriptional regulator
MREKSLHPSPPVPWETGRYIPVGGDKEFPWTKFGLDNCPIVLLYYYTVKFELDRKSPVPFYRQIVDTVLVGVAGGLIQPGEKLPTIRELAVELEVNPNTVVKAYSHLQMMGVLDTQQGSGAFVRQPTGKALTRGERDRIIEDLCRDFIGRAQILNIGIDELVDHLERANRARE